MWAITYALILVAALAAKPAPNLAALTLGVATAVAAILGDFETMCAADCAQQQKRGWFNPGMMQQLCADVFP